MNAGGLPQKNFRTCGDAYGSRRGRAVWHVDEEEEEVVAMIGQGLRRQW